MQICRGPLSHDWIISAQSQSTFLSDDLAFQSGWETFQSGAVAALSNCCEALQQQMGSSEHAQLSALTPALGRMAAVTWKEAQTQYDHKHLAPGQKYKGMSATMYSDADGIQTGCHLLMIHRGGAMLMLAPEQCPSSSLTAALSANPTTLTCRWAQHSMTPVRIVCSAA